MKKKIIVIIIFIVLIIVLLYLFGIGGKRTDVYLQDYSVSNDGNTIKIKVGVSSSSGYIRNVRINQSGTNQFLTFYSTFGINNKINSHNEFILDINELCGEIYFYQGDGEYFYQGHGGYKCILERDSNEEWILSSLKTELPQIDDEGGNDLTENTNNLTLDKLKEMIAEKGANLTWSDFEDYSSNDVGFGLYIRLYKINEDYNLYIGGPNEKEEPLYIRLVSTNDENRFIDIREDNIDDFFEYKRK